jgi:hypothetical protein
VTAEDCDARVCPIWFVLCVFREPVEHFGPETSIARARQGNNRQCIEQCMKALPLFPMGQMKAGFH